MKKAITIIIVAAILIVVDYFALSGLSQPLVEAHRREFLADWFTGSIADWIGLSGFNVLLLIFAYSSVTEPDFYEEVGSNAKTIGFFFVLPIAFIALIYFA
jgi:hypothetical protein